jgi:hypothetical protein
MRASPQFNGIANALLRALENGLCDEIADRVGAPGKVELHADLIENEGHQVNVFRVEWRVLENAIDRHGTSRSGGCKRFEALFVSDCSVDFMHAGDV